MREKILNLLVYDNFISGEKLAKYLNVSRTAVWKQIKILKELGYNIESVKNKGYRLISRPEIPISEEVKYKLNTKIIGKKVFFFKTLPSTNSYCKKLVKNKIQEGSIVIAEIQTKGRGRKERKWISHMGGLWFSVILYPNIPPQLSMYITMAISVSVVQGIKEITNLNPIIKWPNDLLLNGKKICGILTELDAEMDRINYSIVGIGINVNNLIDIKLKDVAISLADISKSKVSILKLLRCILIHLDFNYNKLISDDYKYIRELWLSYTDIIGRKIQVISEKTFFEGIVFNIDESGCLILKTNNGNIKIVSGDIKYL